MRRETNHPPLVPGPPPDPNDEEPNDDPKEEADAAAAAAVAAAATAVRARQSTRHVYLDLECEADLRKQPKSEADRRLMGVYRGGTVHQNDRRHLLGGVANDAAMCMLYDNVVSWPHPLYDPLLKGLIGKWFVRGLTAEWVEVRERGRNSEQALIYTDCILRKESGITSAGAIKRRIERRLDQWDRGEIATLVQDIVTTVRQGHEERRTGDDDEITRRFDSMVASGKTRPSVRMATDHSRGGPLQPGDTDAKSGKKVLKVLRDKHPEMMVPDLADPEWLSFEGYDDLPDKMFIDCDEGIVQEVAGKLSGGAGPPPLDRMTLRKWLLNFGTASQQLQEEMAIWTELMRNELPPWAMIRTLMDARMIALDKKPGVRPVSIGEA
jgi:hypothetical protein